MEEENTTTTTTTETPIVLSRIQNKEQLLEQVKQWAIIEKRIEQINANMQEYRRMKNALNDNIVNYLQENKLDNKRIPLNNGFIGVVNKKEYNGLSFSFLEECLNEIVTDKKTVKDIIHHVKDKRKFQIKSKLVGL